ncbi:MAG: FecR domain-containing protein [Corticimicrobacter sp.]|uniref:FecR domain-containing protein n=1 Tax=Corticimicrobacter sp. TaxID=2678536 RepID=UPI0032DA3606
MPCQIQPAEEQPILEAAHWYACLAAEDATPEDRRDWQSWLEASPAHRQAWDRLQQVQRRFERVPGDIAAAVLSSPSRRRFVLRSLLPLAGAGLLATGAYRLLLPATRADWRTATGEQRRIQLEDGSELYLNTATAVQQDFTTTHRRLVLHSGEILIQTHPDSQFPESARPFTIRTRHGEIEALGTRFTVRLDNTSTQVQVLQHAVAIQPVRNASDRLRLQAGQAVTFDATDTGPILDAPTRADAWLQGRLAVVDAPLSEVIAELSRYRPGILDCASGIASLKVSGVFSLNDTDEALAALADSFPVQVRRRTRYWVTLLPR